MDGAKALEYWASRLAENNVGPVTAARIAGRDALRLEDPEGQRLLLVDDGGAPVQGEPWEGAGVPAPVAIRGFYSVTLSVPSLPRAHRVLGEVLGFRAPARQAAAGEPTVYSTGSGGPGRELWVVEEPTAGRARLGAGGVHHVAFRVADAREQEEWRSRIVAAGLDVSPFIDRFYFRSIYFRISNGILFEIATDGPGFAADEAAESLGQRLALPPFLEPQRERIEAGLKPIVATRN